MTSNSSPNLNRSYGSANQKLIWTNVLAILMVCASLAQAQLPRTWVSGVGNDANPCDRAAPCRTFSGALAKTAAGGEISVLDSGSFDPVTITQSITISGNGHFASILAPGTDGIVVNAGANDTVILRGLAINGAGTGTNGIRLLAGGALHIQDCDIYGFNAGAALGIAAQSSAVSRLFVEDTTLRNNGVFATIVGGGILLNPGPAGAVGAYMRNVTVDRNVTGIRVNNNAFLFIRDSVIAGNRQNGFLVESIGGGAANSFLDHVSIVANQLSGLVSSGAGALARITNISISGNFVNGLQSASSGQILSFGTNNISGNAINGAPTGVLAQQ